MKNRELTLNIFRYDPNIPGREPYMQPYSLQETEGMTIFIALNQIRENQDPSLKFDFVCRAAICGSCGMLVNGRPRLACKTLTRDLPEVITLMPLPVFKLIGDLSVDTGSWFRQLSIKTGAWVHSDKSFNPNCQEERMSNETALKIYEAERCIECGCCIAGCATANIRDDFLGAAGLYKIARFMVDPRDERPEEKYFDVVSSEEGVFGCLGLMACEDNCPMELPLQVQLAYVRRKMALIGFRV
ncbi:MAG: fumarate reductase iron-sulfur subunit [Desulfotomaculum sp.]|nr:fumarate reductase iron-sulfur subunit [Desulfotomaculum sp.]